MDPVLIVGGGPVGLITSLLLSDLGVDHVLFERHDGTSIHPKAVGLNQRTIEILRGLGLEDAIREAAAPPSTVGRTGWYTSLAGSTPLHGRQIAIRDAWGGGEYEREYLQASPAPYTILPQIRLEPILLEAARAKSPATIRFGTEVTAVDQDHTGVTVTLADGETVRGSYLVGADGGKLVADALDIAMTGPTNLVDMVSAHFSADLSDLLPNQECLIYWFVNPDLGGSIGSGYLYHLGPWNENGTSQEWVFACGFGPDDPERFDEAGMRARILRSFGVDQLDAQLHSISHWYIQSVVADRYRDRRCFLVGDAAHRIPPWGALGLNTGAQDAYNLAWKLAAVLADPAVEPLLDSYETERRPVATTVAENSLHNFRSHGGVIDAAIGLGPEVAPGDGWAALADLWSDSDTGRTRQAKLDDAVRFMDREFHAHGVENGFAYVSGAVVADPSAETLPEDSIVYRPTSRPGHRLPHAWLEGSDSPVSTLDLAGTGTWALITDSETAAWSEAVGRSASPLAPAIEVVRVGAEPHDPSGRWQSLREVGPAGAILVRPDQVVAWRQDDLPDDPAGALDTALAALIAD